MAMDKARAMGRAGITMRKAGRMGPAMGTADDHSVAFLRHGGQLAKPRASYNCWARLYENKRPIMRVVCGAKRGSGRFETVQTITRAWSVAQDWPL